MSKTELTLKEMLEQMYVLASKGHDESSEWDKAYEQYTEKLMATNDRIEIRNAVEYLEGMDEIGSMNIEFMIEVLQDRLLIAV